MNPYFFLFYCSFVMNRKLASKNWMERVPDSAVYFVNGLGILFVGGILYWIGGPPPRKPFVYVVVLAILYGIATLNNFIFLKKDRYKNIIGYYDSRYSGRPPRLFYFIVPICYIMLMFFLSLIHDHYADYYRINGLK
jgi:hypothetical protein